MRNIYLYLKIFFISHYHIEELQAIKYRDCIIAPKPNNLSDCIIYSNMTKVKWLWSISIAMGIVLLYASLSAYFIKIHGWYEELILPSVALSPKGMAVGWSLAYIVNIAIIARLIFHRKHTLIILPLVILGVLNIIWCMTFFTFCSPIASFVILIIECALIFAIFVMLIRRDTISMIIIEPLFAWYVYLAIVNYYIFMRN